MERRRRPDGNHVITSPALVSRALWLRLLFFRVINRNGMERTQDRIRLV